MVYLDNAATSQYTHNDEIIIQAMTDSMRELWQNPSSLYASRVKEKVNKCRSNIAKFIGAQSDEIYFTSGASESNNWAIQGWINNQILPFISVITTPIEHKSILETVGNKTSQCFVYYCKVDEFGIVDYQSLKNILTDCGGYPKLISIGLANNEIGTIQNIKRISDLVHSYGGMLHVDATQAFGHIPIDVSESDIDLMSASGHKISPVLKGVGFLYKRNGVDIQPLIYGAQENGLRGGTENTFGIIGLSKALELCEKTTQQMQELCAKRDYFIELLKSKFSKSGFGVKLNGHPAQRLPNNINVTFAQNITGEALLYTLEMSGIYVSTGSACNSKEVKPSHVLKAIGLSDEQTMKTVRFSLPNDITYEEIDKVIEEIDKSIKLIEA